jgi:hypothetical protein
LAVVEKGKKQEDGEQEKERRNGKKQTKHTVLLNKENDGEDHTGSHQDNTWDTHPQNESSR